MACTPESGPHLTGQFPTSACQDTTTENFTNTGISDMTSRVADDFPLEAPGFRQAWCKDTAPETAHMEKVIPGKRRKTDNDGFVLPDTPKLHGARYARGVKDQQQSHDAQLQENEQMPTWTNKSEESDAYRTEQPETLDQKASNLLPQQSMWQILKDMGQEAKQIHNNWAQVFSEGESFELFCTTRLEKLQEEADVLEQRVMKQKQDLYNRLQGLSDTLTFHQ